MNKAVQVYPQTRAVTHRIRDPQEVWKGQRRPYRAEYRANNHSRTFQREFDATDDEAAIQRARDLTPPHKPKDLVYMVLTHVWRLEPGDTDLSGRPL